MELVGENGAGKTTLIRHIFGSAGSKFRDRIGTGESPIADPEKVLANIGYISEDRDLPD